jgi:cytochrome c oxidase cbb3-type subunit III
MSQPRRAVGRALVRATLAVVLCGAAASAQNSTQPTAPVSKPPAVPGPDFPRPPGAPESIARGKQIYSVNCAFCHGSGARGGEGGGPNLLRSPIVMVDQKGEVLAAFVSTGRPDKGMPTFNLPADSIADVAAYLHSINFGAEAAPDFNPKTVLVGNPAAGKAFFNGKGRCTSCHSVAKDLSGVGSKYDPQHLQDMIFTAGGTGIFGEPSASAPPVRVTVVLPSGETINGRLTELDDFSVVLVDDSGNRMTIARRGNTPKIEVHDPLQWHRDRVRQWEDRDLHDLTAYLATLK